MTKRDVLDEVAYRMAKLKSANPNGLRAYEQGAVQALDALWAYLYYNLTPGNPGARVGPK